MRQITQYCDTKTTNIFGFTGNIVPHSWYTQITSDSGKPDHNAISIFSEIVYWYRPGREGRSKFQGETWQTSYEHFESRFCYNKQRIRRGLVRLEELGLIRRELRTIEKYGQKYSNVLFIKLLAIPGEKVVSSNWSDNSNNIRPEMSSGKLLISSFSSFSSVDDVTDSYNNEQNSCLNKVLPQSTEEIKERKKIYLPLDKFDTPSLQICREHYIDKENKLETKENRSDLRASTLSNFSSFLREKEEKSSNNEQNSCLDEILPQLTEKNKNIFSSATETAKKLFCRFGSKSKPLDWKEGRVLSELSGISEEDMNMLNKRSGRQFSVNFIDQLILKLGIKCPEHRFFRHEQFMNYMVKALSNEILQAPQANNEDFKFACLPKTEEEEYQKRVNKYLEDIESSTDTSHETRLKKKILGKLEPRLAYEIISGTSLVVVEKPITDISNTASNIDINELLDSKISQELHIKVLRRLRLNSFVNESTTEIPDWIKQILLEEARGIYGEFVMTCGITVEERTSNILPNPHVKRTFSTKISTNKVKMLELRDDRIDSVDYVNIDKNQNSVQSQVARRLREIYGLATYKSWFSKLNIVDTDVEVDTIEAKTKTEVKIQTQTRFVRDWVRINYGTVIEQVLKGFLPNLQYVEFV